MFSRSKKVRTYPTRAVGEPAGGSHTRHDLPSIVAVMDSMRELGEAVVAGDRDRYRNAYARARRLRLTSEQIYNAVALPAAPDGSDLASLRLAGRSAQPGRPAGAAGHAGGGRRRVRCQQRRPSGHLRMVRVDQRATADRCLPGLSTVRG